MRGRPPDIKNDTPIRQYVQIIKYDDGCSTKWTFDLDKNPNGPLEVEMIYPEGWDDDEVADIKKSKDDKKQYLNVKTGKYVAKFRAKQLGLI